MAVYHQEREMIVVDAHQDIAFNAISFNRDYRMSAMQKRHREAGSWAVQQNGTATLGLPEALAGRVAVVFATIFTAPYSRHASSYSRMMYRDAAGAYRVGSEQADYYERITDEDDRLRLIHNATDLDEVLATWEGDDVRQRQQALVLLMENADPIIEPRQFEEWYERGVRIVGPAWVASRYSGGTDMPGPLTDLGRELLDVMMDFNAVLDVSHMAEDAYLESMDRYDGPIIASHSNPRHFCNTDRHLSDEMIGRLVERDGVMGVVLYNAFLDGTWTHADHKHDVTMTRVIDIIDHVCQIAGSADHVGIGSDFDGGFGAESIPAEVDTVADLWQIRSALLARGFAEDDVAAIMGGNMLRKLRQGL